MEKFSEIIEKKILFLFKTMWIFCIIFGLLFSSYPFNVLDVLFLSFRLIVLAYGIIGLVATILFRHKIKKRRRKFILLSFFAVFLYGLCFTVPVMVRLHYNLTNKCPIGYTYYGDFVISFSPVCHAVYCSNFGGNICRFIGKKADVELGDRCEYIKSLGFSPVDGSCG